MKSNTLSQNVKTCGQCRYFNSEGQDVGDCYVNPPVIVEVLVVRALEMKTCNDFIAAGSFRPVVEPDAIACRFFDPKGDAA